MIKQLPMLGALLMLWGCSPEFESLPLDPLQAGRTGNPNDALFCPVGACTGADATSPVFDMTPQQQLELWRQVITAEPRTRIRGSDADRLLIHAEQRSLVFRFVDTILIRVTAADPAGSSFIAYSRSEVGRSDLGVNMARLERWIAELETRAE